MVELLPPDLLQAISQICPCRESQIVQCATYLSSIFPSPPVLVAYGLENASKIEVIVNVLEKRGITHTVIRSRECLSQRHLLSKIFTSCVAGLGQEPQIEQYDRVDSLNALLGNLRRLFDRVRREFVVVLEGIDRLKHAGQTLLFALARLGDQVPGLSIILTSNSPKPLLLRRAGVPYVHFPPYTRSEAIHIITSQRPPLLPDPLPNTAVQIDKDNVSKLYTQFAVTIYDSLIAPTSSTSIQTFRSTCNRLWPRFILPLVSGQAPPGRAKSWDFAKLIVVNRGLFQAEGENALHDNLPTHLPQRQTGAETGSISAPSTPSRRSAVSSQKATLTKPDTTHSARPPLLKHFPTLILLSSYLASHTHAKHDILLFSRLSSASSATSKKIRRLRQTPTKRKANPTPNGTPSKAHTGPTTPTKSRSKSVYAANASLGIPRPFTLERLLAILRAVHPHGISNRPGSGVSDRVYRELGELEKLRLVVRTSGSSSGGTAGIAGGASGASGAADDATEEKWRINVGRDWVVSLGHVWGVGISEYEIEKDL